MSVVDEQRRADPDGAHPDGADPNGHRGDRQPETNPPRKQRVGLRSLLPYLRSYRATLVLVAVMSLANTGGTLAQPLLTRAILERVTASRPVGWYMPALVGLVVGVAVLSSVREYLLQRTAEGLVLTARHAWSGTCCACPSPSTTSAAPVICCPGSAPTPRCCGRW